MCYPHLFDHLRDNEVPFIGFPLVREGRHTHLHKYTVGVIVARWTVFNILPNLCVLLSG